MAHPHLVVETSPAGFRWVRLSRPERRNALDVSLLRSLTDALAAEPGRPVVLASADPRVFCAGADLTITDAERAAVSDLVYDCCETIITRPGPVIAVLTGPAVGGGAQLAAPNRRVVGLTGDGGFNMTLGELETARRANTPFVLCVFNNAASGYVKALQHSMFGSGNYQSSDLVEMDYAAIARAMGCNGIRVEDPDGLGPVNRVCEDPEPAAAQIAADLAGRGTGAAGAGVKAVMAAGGLLDRMRAERAVNRSAWNRVLAGQ